MTVENTNPIQHFTANGEATVFAIDFDVEGKDNIKVTVDGETVTVNDYSYDAAVNAIVFITAPAAGAEVIVERVTSLDRSINYQTYNNSFRPEMLNYDLDRIWHVLQEDHITDAEILARIKDEIEWRRTHNTEWDLLAQAREQGLFNALKSYMDTIGAMSVPNLFDGITDNVVITEDGVSQRVTNRDVKQELADLHTSLFSAVNTAKTYTDTETTRAVNAETTLNTVINNEIGRAVASESGLQNQVNAIGVGNKAYLTYAGMDADKANIAAKSKVTVTNDATAANNGDWQYDGATFTKSSYDPLTQSKNYTDSQIKAAVLPANSDLNNLTLTNGGYFIVNANASSMLNMPEQSNGFGFESVDSLGNKTQWYISQPLNNFWFRTEWNGVWKEWKKNADATQVIPVTTQRTGAQTLASYEDQGIYNFASTATISDLPTDAQAGVGYTLRVENYLSGDRFKIQYLCCDSAKTGLKWERSLDKQNHTVGTWILTPRLHDAQIVPENLSASFRYKGAFTSVAISDYKSDGLYTFITPIDKPTGASSTSGTVEVKNWFSGTMVLQTWVTWTKPNEVFMRYINSSGTGEWVAQTTSGGNTQFAGKKIICFGDSITEFGSYPTQLANRLGATGYNIGFGGCRWGKHSNALYDEMCMYKVADYIATDNLTGLMNAAIALRDSSQADDNTAQVARLQSLDLSTVDYVTIFHGTNDFQGLNPIGTDSDMTGDTVKGAINLTLDKLLTKYPNMKLLLVTPIWRARQVAGDGLESDAKPNSLGLYLRDYVEAIKDMGKKYHIPVLDLYNNSGISKYTKNLYLSSDELHPNTVGYTHLANLIAAKLSSTY